MRILPAAAALLLALVLPPGAGAAPLADVDSLLEGPRIVDGGAAWVELTGSGWAVRASREGSTFTGARGDIPEADDETGDSDDDISAGGQVGGFVAAGAVAAVELRTSGGNTKARQYQTTSEVRRVPLAGATVAGSGAALASCSEITDSFGGTGTRVPAEAATDGRAIAVDQCGATKIFDAGTGEKVAELPGPATPPATREVAIAGAFLASLEGAEVVVRDWRAATEAYRVPVPASPPATVAFDVQDDGALALLAFPGVPGCGRATLTWHTPAAPAGIVLPAEPCTAQVAAAAGRAAVVTTAPGGRVVATIGPEGERRDIAWLGTGAGQVGDLGYSAATAGTVVYALERCGGGATVHEATGTATPAAVDCPRLRFSSARVRGRALRVRGRLAIRDSVSLAVTYRAAGRTWRRRVRASGGRFSLNLRLPARARRRAGRLAVAYAGDGTYRPETARRRVREPRRG